MLTGKEESVRYVQFDENKIVLNVSGWRVTALVWLVLFLLGADMYYDKVPGQEYDFEWIDIVALSIAVLSLFLAIVSLAWFVFYRKKFVVFDRDKGTVSIPGPFWFKNMEIPFKDVVAIIRRENRYYGTAKVLNLYRPDGYKTDVGINTHDLDELKRDWAFYVWYMDGNRTLPPVPVFNTSRLASGSNPVYGKTM